MSTSSDPPDAIARAVAGDEHAFAQVVEPYRRSLFRHCYRMLGSGLDAEEATQDTMVRAWRRLDSYNASGALGGWLYRVATNVCLDMLRSRRTRNDPVSLGPASAPGAPLRAPDPELAWVEPVGNASIARSGDPLDEIVRREDISLAFVAALQRLAPRQRACLLLHDVLGFKPAEVIEALDISRSAFDSLLFRAREAVRRGDTGTPLDPTDPQLQALLDAYVRAWQVAEIDLFVQLIAADIRFSMPPMSEWYEGREAVAAFLDEMVFAAARPYGITLRAGWCNAQPAFATYAPAANGALIANGLQILDVELRDGRAVIAAIVSYRDPSLAVRCGLPDRLS